MNDFGRNLTLEKMHSISVSTSRFHHEPQFIWLMQGKCKCSCQTHENVVYLNKLQFS